MTDARFIASQAARAWPLLMMAAVVAACGVGGPKARDASGRPVFDDTKVRHPANEPYYCFRLVTAEGDEVSQCDVIKDWCVQEMQRSKNSGLTILSGCRDVEAVSCYVAYATGGMIANSQSFCWETPKDCQAMQASSSRQMGDDNVSACKLFERAFHPPG